MEKVVLEPAIRSRLTASERPVAFVDENGVPYGRYVPEEMFQSAAYAWARASISDEELDRRASEPGGASLEQILRQLEKP
jgi:hypothetical protein